MLRVEHGLETIPSFTDHKCMLAFEGPAIIFDRCYNGLALKTECDRKGCTSAQWSRILSQDIRLFDVLIG